MLMRIADVCIWTTLNNRAPTITVLANLYYVFRISNNKIVKIVLVNFY